MIIIGVDFHPEFQQIALMDTDTGEFQEKRLGHREEAEKFYRALAAAGQKVRVGMEASGHGRWFERLLSELQFELWIGDAAEIRTKRVRKQKTDRQDEERDGLNREIRVDNILKNESREDVSRKLGARVGVTVVAKAIKKHNSRF